jgi:hypothetical protein
MKAHILPILFLAILATTSYRALALAGTLDRPSIAFPQSIDPHWRDSVTEALATEGAQFLDGRFINATTTLRYGGSTDALSRFLDRLARCSGLRLRIRFDRALDANWTVNHNAWGDPLALEVRIHPDPAHINLPDLVLPEIVGSAAAKQPDRFLKSP